MDEKLFNRVAKDILESMFGFVAVDTEGKITYISHAYAGTQGFTQEECIGRPVGEIIPNSRLPIVLKRRKNEMGRYMVADGSSAPGSVCNRLLIYQNGSKFPEKVVGAMGFGIIHDLQDSEFVTRELELLRKQNSMYQEHLAEIYQTDKMLDDLLGRSAPIQEVKDVIRRVAGTAVSVCIFGETGTGKELVANAIHGLSKRADKPFVKINCAAIPKDLMESELFGYEPGSFTGASRQGKIGKFELANGGTLLLDEIGELPLNLQAKLLRVLQSNEIERIGGTAPIPIDVRFLCSTNRDLKQMIQEGTFRADLFYRIHTMEIPVPPLRERPEDIPALTKHFIEKANLRNDLNVTGLNPKARDLLISYSWPGNVRELEHAVERACVLCGDGNLSPEHFSLAANKSAVPVRPSAHETAPLWDKTSSLEQQAILDALEICQGNKRAAADLLQITRATLYSKLKKYNIQL